MSLENPRCSRSVRNCLEHFPITAGRFLNKLLFDPAIGLLHSLAKTDSRLPSETVENHRVVAVTAVYTFRSIKIISSLKANAGDLLHYVDKAVNGHQFAGTQIDGLCDIAVHDHLRSLYTVVDIHKTSCLLSVSPDVDYEI